jgi:hypothetical protein
MRSSEFIKAGARHPQAQSFISPRVWSEMLKLNQYVDSSSRAVLVSSAWFKLVSP